MKEGELRVFLHLLGPPRLDDLKCSSSTYIPNVSENRKISTLKALLLGFFLTQHPTVFNRYLTHIISYNHYNPDGQFLLGD